ncbi:MAG: lytic transglycosylase domain-containing protein [Rhizobiales bacterium]|nr:lytic transglycosylase domain-containing protein [Hyphomicrobiales bacterium]
MCINIIFTVILFATFPQAQVLIPGENSEFSVYNEGFKFTEPNREKTSKQSVTPISGKNNKITRKTPAKEILTAIEKTALRYGSNIALKKVKLSVRDWTKLFRANIEIESGYKVNAKSPVGAYGLGQLMPQTAKALGVDRLDYMQNLDGSARYLLAQINKFGDIKLAIAAYNAGPNAVHKYGGIPPYKETINHVRKVLNIYDQL